MNEMLKHPYLFDAVIAVLRRQKISKLRYVFNTIIFYVSTLGNNRKKINKVKSRFSENNKINLSHVN